MKKLYTLFTCIFILSGINSQGQSACFTYSTFPPSAPMCEGITLIFDGSCSTGATSWNWDFGPNAIPSTSNLQFPGLVQFTTCDPNNTVTLTINGGGGGALTYTQNIPIYCTPLACFTVNLPNVCLGTPVTFNSSCSQPGIGSNSLTYQWDLCDGSGPTNANPTHTYTDTGCFCAKLIVTNNHGCTDFHQENNAVCVIPSPTITVNHIDASCLNCHDGSATVLINGGTPPYTIQWNTGSTGNPIINIDPGVYQVCITDANGCSVCDSVTVGYSIGINSITENDFVQIIPNPNNGNFTLYFSSSVKPEQIEVYNLLGEKIYSLPNTDWKQSAQINLSFLSDGIYFLKIESAQNLIMKKIVISRK